MFSGVEKLSIDKFGKFVILLAKGNKMINSLGIIQNNKGVAEFLKNLKESNVQYKTLTKQEERDMIDDYLKRGEEDELRKLLVMHNIRLVFSISKKYCKDTRDFDNMVARGLYGLVYAANRFNLFEPIKRKFLVGYSECESTEMKVSSDGAVELSGKKRPVYIDKIVINPTTCKPEYVKFCTYANNWIFKYVFDEFGKKSILIDNNSISIDDKVKIRNSFDNNQTMENYIDEMISPDHVHTKDTIERVSDDDVTAFYEKIGEYLKETNELTALEKQIVIDTYYNNKKIRDIADEFSENPQSIVTKKIEALKKIKNFLKREYNLEKIDDILV